MANDQTHETPAPAAKPPFDQLALVAAVLLPGIQRTDARERARLAVAQAWHVLDEAAAFLPPELAPVEPKK